MIYVFVTGGVISGLGKGVLAASLAQLTIRLGLKTTILKIDPYLNIDPGTMNPSQHGEVFVTNDGMETDLDLGHYERFMDVDTNKQSTVTMGKIFNKVLTKERDGKYLGETIQLIPHISNEISDFIKEKSQGYDLCFIEVGGTVGDIEAELLLHEMCRLQKYCKCIYIHLAKLDLEIGEIKTKPIQQSIQLLNAKGIIPDITIIRSYQQLTAEQKTHIKYKLKDINTTIFFGETINNIYELPLYFEAQGILDKLAQLIGIQHNLNKRIYIPKVNDNDKKYTILLCGKYKGKDSYISIEASIQFAAKMLDMNVELVYVDMRVDVDFEQIKEADGIIIPGGFGDVGMENKISIAKIAREKEIPILGICLGLQIMVIEFARNVCNINNAISEEFPLLNGTNVIHLMKDQKYIDIFGGTMRLGAYSTTLILDSIAYKAYNKLEISERHRHRYEVNNNYIDCFKENGLKITGIHNKLDLVEIIELPIEQHPFFVGVQFHPEFTSRPNKPNPLFKKFIEVIRKDCDYE